MSRKLVKNALLEGFEGPVLGISVEELRLVLEPLNFCGVILRMAASRMQSHVGQLRPRTSDGYWWFWAHLFTAPSGGEVFVLIPFAQDFKKTDGSQFDRSIAVYTRDFVRYEEIHAILREFALEIEVELELIVLQKIQAR